MPVDFKKLVYLDMSFNQLRQISRFGYLKTQLQYLDLSNNYIAENDLIKWQHIKKFKGIPQNIGEDLS